MFYDVIIVGAGVAGLSTALNLPESLSVLVVSKDYPWECNTFYAQGGVAVALEDKNDVEVHIKDTLEAGSGHCNEEAVRILCEEAPEAIKKLIKNGCEFDKDEHGNILFTKEAAHTNSRVIHAGGDATGRNIHLALLKRLKTTLLYNTQVVDLLMEGDICHGIKARDTNGQFYAYASHVVLASGGVGSLYEYHTNARTISADLQGIALTHGMRLKDMHLMQFHPTAYIKTKTARKQLISEALRGEGAKVVDEDGYEFLYEYDERGALASRDIVSQSIFLYKQRTDKEVFLDISPIRDGFMERFPSIYFAMQNEGLDVPHVNIPISPAFHYAMGGIAVDLSGRVEGMRNLYAVGEVACNGLHGANRLASNSLLEGIVFSFKVVEAILGSLHVESKKPTLANEVLSLEGDKAIKNELRVLMWQNAGIVRDEVSLQNGLNRVKDLLECRTGKLLRLRLLSSFEILRQALDAKQSLGAHFLIKSK